MIQQEHKEMGQYIPLHYHYQMLTDSARMTSFRNAIEQVVNSFNFSTIRNKLTPVEYRRQLLV